MRKLIFTLLLSSTFIFSLKAGHLIGGELQFECIKSGPDAGKFIFKVIKYRTCAMGASPNLAPTSITNPFGPVIPTTFQSNRDLSPSCYNSSLGLDCDGGTVAQQNSTIEEFVFTSAPIAITGTPPVSGAIFTSSDCCRPTGITNSNSSGSFIFRAIMYPYMVNGVPQPLGTSSSPSCYDSSPKFAEDVSFVTCAESPVTFNHKAYDHDGDEVRVRWAHPWIIVNSNMPFASGFSFDNPFPSPGIPTSPSNVSVILDSLNGDIKLTPFDIGQYINCLQYDSYRNGQLISSIFREIPLIIISCPPMAPPISSVNYAPNVQFNNNGVISSPPYRDTVYAGDVAEFKLTALDGGVLPGLVSQSVTITPSGNFFGIPFSDSLSGCPTPYCATLDMSSVYYNATDNNWQGSGSAEVDFRWQTTCDHLSGNTSNFHGPKTYQFYFNVADNYCPVPASNIITATIVVLPDTGLGNLITLDSIIDHGDSISMHWPQYTGTGFNGYYIYKYDAASGLYKWVEFFPSLTTTNYTDTAPGIIQQYYVVADTAECLRNIIYSPVKVNAQNTPGGPIEISWNYPTTGGNPGGISYDIYRSSGGPFMHLGTAGNPNFTDPNIPCSDTLIYMVKTTINGVTYTTSLDTVLVKDFTKLSITVIKSISDTSGGTELTWTRLQELDSYFYGYVIFVADDSTGPFTAVDTVTNLNTTRYYHSTAGVNANVRYHQVIPYGYSVCNGMNMLAQKSNTLTTSHLDITDLNNGLLQLNWKPFYNKNNKSANGIYKVYRQFQATGWILLDSAAFNNEQMLDSVYKCNVDILYKVDMDTAGKFVSVTNFIRMQDFAGLLVWNDSLLKGPSGLIYQWYRNDSLLDVTTSTYVPTLPGNYRLEVKLANGCTIFTNSVNLGALGTGTLAADIHELTVFPNPHSGSFDITVKLSNGDKASFELYDNTGKLVLSKILPTATSAKIHKEHIEMENWPNGMYMLKMNINGNSYFKKVIYSN